MTYEAARASVAAAMAAAVLVLAGCGSSTVPLDSRPTNKNSSKDLAHSVAESANCGSFDYLGAKPDVWVYSCQYSATEGYSIWSATAKTAIGRLVESSKNDGTPVVVGDYYAVTTTSGEYVQSENPRFKTFPGTLIEGRE